MAKANNKVQFRAQIPAHLDFLVRVIAPLMNSGKDWNLSDITEQALIDWLNKPENAKLIKRHKLIEAAKQKEFEWPKDSGIAES